MSTRFYHLLSFFEYNKSINTKTFLFFSSLTKQLINFIKTISQLYYLNNVTNTFKIKFKKKKIIVESIICCVYYSHEIFQ